MQILMSNYLVLIAIWCLILSTYIVLISRKEKSLEVREKRKEKYKALFTLYHWVC